MIKNLCFRPLYLDNLYARNVNCANISILNSSGLKRRWKLILQHEFECIDSLQDLLLTLEFQNSICAIGVNLDLAVINKKILNLISNNRNIFLIFDINNIDFSNKEYIFYLQTIIENNCIFLPNNNRNYYENALKLKSSIESTDKILFESTYKESIDDFSLGANIYLDFTRMQQIKKYNYSKFFISTSYNDTLKFDNKLESYCDWDFFRKNGLVDLIYFLRDNELLELEIVNCVYNKFIDFF